MSLQACNEEVDLAEIYKNLPEIAKTGFIDKASPDLAPSPWNIAAKNPDTSGVRKSVSGKVNDVMTSRPLFQLPPLTVDQSFLDANEGYNFNNLTASRQDINNWNIPITQEWLDRYNREMGYSEKSKITMEEAMLPKNTQLRRMLAQFALQDRANAVKAEVGPRPVPYNEIPVTTPEPKPYKSNAQIHMPHSRATEGAKYVDQAEKRSLGSRIASAASNVATHVSNAASTAVNTAKSVFTSAGKALSKLKFW